MKLGKPSTTKIFLECDCVARNKPIRCEKTKQHSTKGVSSFVACLRVASLVCCDCP